MKVYVVYRPTNASREEMHTTPACNDHWQEWVSDCPRTHFANQFPNAGQHYSQNIAFTPEKIPDLKLGSLLKSVQVLPISFLAEVGISVHKYASAHASDVGCSKAMPLIDGSVFFSNLEQINPYMYFLILVASNLPHANHVCGKGSPQSWHRLESQYSSAAYKPT